MALALGTDEPAVASAPEAPSSTTAPSFRRAMGLPDAVSLVIGCIIGAGIFRMAAPIAQQLQHPGLVLATWLAGGLISLCGAVCYAELGAAFPKCGGDYVYLTAAYGRAVGFLFGWTKLFIERTGTIAVLGFVFAEYLGYFTGYGPGGIRLAATAAIIGLTTANLVGVRYGAGVQNLFTTLKLLALAAIVGVGWASGGARPELLQPWWPSAPSLSHLQACGVALVFVLWTYGGWTESAYVAEEIRRPERNVPRSILLGVGATTAIYMVVNLVYMLYVPLAEMPQQKLVAAEMMRRALGPWAGGLVSLGVMCSTFGALNGYVLTSGRLLYAIGAEHPLVGRLGIVHPRWATPARALAFNAAWAVALVWTGTLDQIVTYSTVVISLFYAMAGVSVLILRRRQPVQRRPRPYRVWGYPIVPLVFVAAMLAFVVDVWMRRPAEAWIGLALLAAGVPLYGLSEWLRRATTRRIAV